MQAKPNQHSSKEYDGVGTNVYKDQSNATVLTAKSKSTPISITMDKTSGTALSNPTCVSNPTIGSALPGHLSHLLAIAEAMESVLATKRGGHIRQLFFRSDKAAIEKSAKRAFKVDHVLQLKTLLCDSMELCWVPQALSKRTAGSNTSAKDLDLAIRFKLPAATPPSPTSATNNNHTPSPVRGRSSTRRSITSSASTPPEENDAARCTSENANNNSAAPSTPVKGQHSGSVPSSPSMRRHVSHGRLRPTLLHSFVSHIASTHPSLEHLGSLTEVLQHSEWDASACPEVSKAVLPTRPSTVAAALASSRRSTPVRNGSVTTMLTPSPSIRTRRDFHSHMLPSPQVTPQSLMPPASRASPPRHAASRSPSTSAMGRVNVMQTPPTKMLRSAHATPQPGASTAFGTPPPQAARSIAEGLAVCPPQHRQHSVCASQQMTPLKGLPRADAQLGDGPVTPRRVAAPEPSGCLGVALPCVTPPRTNPMPFATPSQTPKRKRADDGSPTQSLPQTPASCRQPVRVRTPATTRAVRAATPGRTPRKELIVTGSTSSPHVRKAILAHARSPKFEGALPIVQMRVPSKSPARTPDKGVLRDVYGKSAHCAAIPTTPASARSTQSRVLHHTSPAMASKRSVSFASPVAGAAAFYTASPQRKRNGQAGSAGRGSVKGTPADKAAPVVRCPPPPSKPVSDAAVLAASIMDDDMAELLQRNVRSAAAKQVAEDPRTIRRSIEQEARKQLPAMYDQLRVEFERRHSLKMPYKECVGAIVDMGLSKAGLTRDVAAVYLEVLIAAVPNWISAHQEGSSKSVCIARMCTGVRRQLEEVSHGYSAV